VKEKSTTNFGEGTDLSASLDFESHRTLLHDQKLNCGGIRGNRRSIFREQTESVPASARGPAVLR
jgi:hypothetical protein